MIVITSKREGFRRCGVAHSRTPTEYEDDRWTDAELKRLENEPNLTVQRKGSGGGKGAANTGEHELLMAAIGAIADLKVVNNPDDWTADGKPQVSALEKAAGQQISARLRDKAWARYQESE